VPEDVHEYVAVASGTAQSVQTMGNGLQPLGEVREQVRVTAAP
jgi:hypothetical protein